MELKIIVKPKSSKNEFYFDNEKNVYITRVKAIAEGGKSISKIIEERI